MGDSEQPSFKREVIENLIGLGIIYLSLHPDTIEKIETKLRQCWNDIRHSFSVWQAAQAIRNLPDTEMIVTTREE